MKIELASWNDGPAKQAIIDFVAAVTAENGEHYVAPDDRLACFDNDGTLWSERPAYFQLLFAIDRVRDMAPDHPEWATTQPFQAVLEEDLEMLAELGESAMVDIVAATHVGMTTEEFAAIVDVWTTSARHPVTGQLFTDMVFQPMLELLRYLRHHGFTTYIVSGGGIEFMRPWSERVYGIPPQQVIGTSIETVYEMREDGPVLVRLAEINHIDDEAGKPVGINRYIGRRPVLAFGNSDGDHEMLQWTASGDGLRFCGLVHHTDAEREYAYDRGAHIGGLDVAWVEALEKGWTVVDMKEDWQRVYAHDQIEN
ncbi:MAG: HAD family hydrolase [Chloroflexota bacterium]|nr:HAD family hydrolase [Chloroflexota bacterium]